VVAAVVVAIVLSGGDPGDSGDSGTSTSTGTATPSVTASVSPAVAALPRSPEPLAPSEIVWATERDGNRDLEVYDVDSGDRRPLTTSPDQDLFALVSEDRRTVVYEHELSRAAHDLRVVARTGPATGRCSSSRSAAAPT
jgi:hypothetical protein